MPLTPPSEEVSNPPIPPDFFSILLSTCKFVWLGMLALEYLIFFEEFARTLLLLYLFILLLPLSYLDLKFFMRLELFLFSDSRFLLTNFLAKNPLINAWILTNPWCILNMNSFSEFSSSAAVGFGNLATAWAYSVGGTLRLSCSFLSGDFSDNGNSSTKLWTSSRFCSLDLAFECWLFFLDF